MRVLVQWARDRAAGWEPANSANWHRLAGKAKPRGVVRTDQNAGWVNAVCIQGLVLQGDAVAVRHDSFDQVTAWLINEDPRSGQYARELTIRSLAPDPALGNAVNTRIDQVVYTDDRRLAAKRCDRTTVRPWSAFQPPDPQLIRYGALLPDPQYDAHAALQQPRSWREWTDGVERALCCPTRMRVRDQRHAGRWNVPKGTRTYYLNSDARANPIHAADHELALGNAPTGATLLQSTAIAANGDIIFSGITDAGEPDSAAWPAGTYRCQIDVNSINSDVTIGLLDQGNESGHFGRLDAALTTELETQQQAEGAFSLPGIKLATNGAAAWTAGNASDRFEVLITGDRPTGMGTGTCTLEVGESDDFSDGPWAAPGVGYTPQVEGAGFF